jgi:hypothetical protein
MPPTTWRERREARQAADVAARWQHRRAVARVAVVDDLVAEYATTFWGRPFRRRDVRPLESAVELAGVTWSIDGEVVVELLTAAHGPSRLLVHQVALLRPIRKRLRSRHVVIEHA